jgi:RNA polymerase sigma factor (sigma-70 family)
MIWDRHAERVMAHLRACGHQYADADELTAAAFLELWRRRSRVRFVDGSVLPWLIVTSRNVARNATRARRRYAKLLAQLPDPVEHRDPAEILADLDSSTRILRTTVAAAKPLDSDLLSLTAIEGFSVKDAANALGLSESAARTRLSRFRSQLRIQITSDARNEGAH